MSAIDGIRLFLESKSINAIVTDYDIICHTGTNKNTAKLVLRDIVCCGYLKELKSGIFRYVHKIESNITSSEITKRAKAIRKRNK